MPYKILKLRHFQSGKGLEIELPVDCTFLHVSCQKPWKTLFEKRNLLKYINQKLQKIVLGNSARRAKSIHVMCSTLKFNQGLHCNQADRIYNTLSINMLSGPIIHRGEDWILRCLKQSQRQECNNLKIFLQPVSYDLYPVFPEYIAQLSFPI